MRTYMLVGLSLCLFGGHDRSRHDCDLFSLTCIQRAGRHVTLRAPRLERSCPHSLFHPRTRRGASPSIYPPPRIFPIEFPSSHSSFVLDAPLPAHTYIGDPLQLPVPPAAASKRPPCTYSGRENEDCVVPALGGPGGRTRRNATPSSLPLLLHVFLARSSTPVSLFLCSCVSHCSKIALITHLLALSGTLSSLQTSWIAGSLRGWGAKAEARRVCSAAVARAARVPRLSDSRFALHYLGPLLLSSVGRAHVDVLGHPLLVLLLWRPLPVRFAFHLNS
ncbi:hypothetical protein B0H14DRAFT_2867965 [Mycena olivaceomarginata]|nr:hypothetical protein B0H14DRAFT_2867965 [Mycena olivaceomarginata]